MKEDFSPYLKDVLPAIFKMASLQPKIGLQGSDQIVDLVDALKETDNGDGTTGEAKKVQVHTDEIEEKDTAVQMLAVFIEECGAGFAPYIEEASKILIGMLDYAGNDKIRSSASDAIPYLVKSAKEAGLDQPSLFNMAKSYI